MTLGDLHRSHLKCCPTYVRLVGAALCAAPWAFGMAGMARAGYVPPSQRGGGLQASFTAPAGSMSADGLSDGSLQWMWETRQTPFYRLSYNSPAREDPVPGNAADERWNSCSLVVGPSEESGARLVGSGVATLISDEHARAISNGPTPHPSPRTHENISGAARRPLQSGISEPSSPEYAATISRGILGLGTDSPDPSASIGATGARLDELHQPVRSAIVPLPSAQWLGISGLLLMVGVRYIGKRASLIT